MVAPRRRGQRGGCHAGWHRQDPAAGIWVFTGAGIWVFFYKGRRSSTRDRCWARIEVQASSLTRACSRRAGVRATPSGRRVPVPDGS